ncbi:MAG: tyrosine recombinase XerC [Ezakiella sp.]|nr:tyrosine recombinase XerC [Ezakiella sp.]
MDKYNMDQFIDDNEIILPTILEDFLSYLLTMKNHSPNTIREYKYDLIIFLRFIKIRKFKLRNIAFDEVDISDIDTNLLNKVDIRDLDAFLAFASNNGKTKATTRYRKIASLRTFFKYLYERLGVIDDNPTLKLEYPKIDSRLPIYLTLNDTYKLLLTCEDVEGQNARDKYLNARDYAILMVFLNCGLRLSELVSLDIGSINEDNSINIIGKGNKERIVFLNASTRDAIDRYLKIRRAKIDNNIEEKALFISNKQNRLSKSAVQEMVKKRIQMAGLDPNKYSVHKLRHTAATLMYKYGDVDILTIKEVLGHSNVATTQIYTHLDTDIVKTATEKNPLSHFDPEEH